MVLWTWLTIKQEVGCASTQDSAERDASSHTVTDDQCVALLTPQTPSSTWPNKVIHVEKNIDFVDKLSSNLGKTNN